MFFEEFFGIKLYNYSTDVYENTPLVATPCMAEVYNINQWIKSARIKIMIIILIECEYALYHT